MKLLSLVTVCCIVGSSILSAESFVNPPFCIEKGSHHHGPRGPRGHRGHHGHQGLQGVTGPQGATGPQGTSGGASSAYIGLCNTVERDISVSDAIIPLGELNSGIEPVLLQYTDTDPADLTADKFIQVLPGGAGKYLVQYSLFASTTTLIDHIFPLQLQLQVDDGSGYNSSIIPVNYFQRIDQTVVSESPTTIMFFFIGSMDVIVSLQDGDKIHLALIDAPLNTTLGPLLVGNPHPNGLSFTMHRIGT